MCPSTRPHSAERNNIKCSQQLGATCSGSGGCCSSWKQRAPSRIDLQEWEQLGNARLRNNLCVNNPSSLICMYCSLLLNVTATDHLSHQLLPQSVRCLECAKGAALEYFTSFGRLRPRFAAHTGAALLTLSLQGVLQCVWHY